MMDAANDRLIKMSEVSVIVGYARSTIYAWIDKGTFPKQCNPGGWSARWSETEVRAWKDAQLARREAA